MLQQTLIEGSYILARRTVYEYAVEDVHRENRIAEQLRTARSRLLQLFLINLQIESLAVEDGILGRSNTHHVQFQLAALHEVGILILDLFDELAAHCTHTADKEVEHLVLREEEAIV